MSDCETLVKSRVTEEYVKNLGERIKAGVIEAVSAVKFEKANLFLDFSSNAKTRTPSTACTASLRTLVGEEISSPSGQKPH